jgi:hypothetical protein
VDLLRRIDDGMNRGKMSEMDFRSFFHPDVEFLPLRAATEGAYHGISGIELSGTSRDECLNDFAGRRRPSPWRGSSPGLAGLQASNRFALPCRSRG